MNNQLETICKKLINHILPFKAANSYLLKFLNYALSLYGIK